MDFPELRMTRVHLSNSENIEDIISGREGHGMEQSRGCRSKDEWAGHQLGLVHLSCPSPLPPCAPLHHHRSPALPKLYWRSWGNWKDINAAPLCICVHITVVVRVCVCVFVCLCVCVCRGTFCRSTWWLPSGTRKRGSRSSMRSHLHKALKFGQIWGFQFISQI